LRIIRARMCLIGDADVEELQRHRDLVAREHLRGCQ
jgi:hypothetical protein